MAEATPTPKFHFRNLRTSKPLQRVYRLLLDGKERTTRQLNRGANVECGPTIVSELKKNGCEIETRLVGNKVWAYKMAQGVEWWGEIC